MGRGRERKEPRIGAPAQQVKPEGEFTFDALKKKKRQKTTFPPTTASPIFPASKFPSSRSPVFPSPLRRPGSLARCPLQYPALPCERPGKFLSAKRAERRAGNSRPTPGGFSAATTTGSGTVRGNLVPGSPFLAVAWQNSTFPSGSRPLPAATPRVSSTHRQWSKRGSGARAAISPLDADRGSSGKMHGLARLVCTLEGSGH